jgi:hypothetical protein
MEVIAVQGDTAVLVGDPREQGIREAAGQFVRRIASALRLPQDLDRDWRKPLIVQEPLIGRSIIRLDKDLMHLFQPRRRAGQGELIIVQPPLNVKVASIKF